MAQFVGQRTSRFVALDERLQPSARTALAWSQVEPTAAALADLRDFFATRDTPFSERIAGSLEHAVVGDAPSAAEMAGVVSRATGLPLVLEAWSSAILAEEPLARRVPRARRRVGGDAASAGLGVRAARPRAAPRGDAAVR